MDYEKIYSQKEQCVDSNNIRCRHTDLLSIVTLILPYQVADCKAVTLYKRILRRIDYSNFLSTLFLFFDSHFLFIERIVFKTK